MMLLRLPDADRVVAQVVGEHRDCAFEIALRIDAEGREARELVQHQCLPSILLGPLELLGREQGRGDIGRDLRQRVHMRLPVALLRGAVLHIHHAERPPIRAQGHDHRFARRRIGSTLDVTGEQDRLTTLRDPARDALADHLAI